MVRRRANAVFTMLRMDRFCQRLLCLWACSALPQLACTLIADVDRSKIPPPAIIQPDPEPEDTDAGAEGPEDNAGEMVDAGSDAAPTETASDAGALEMGDAQATGE
jgi:hypothetical protein